MDRTRFAATVVLLGGALACRPEPPLPPDPEEPVPEVTCDDEGAPLGLARTAADSGQGLPTWLQVCTLCPSTALELVLSGPDGEAPLTVGWGAERTCAFGLAHGPVPEVSALDVDVVLTVGEQSGSFSYDLPLAAGRGPDPADLGTATWRLSWDSDDLRLPVGLDLEAVAPDGLRDMLLHLGEPDALGARAVTVGVTEPGGGVQDLCAPTQRWLGAAKLDRLQLGAELLAGDMLPTPLGGPVERGALQARMSTSGSALQSGAIAALVDLSALEEQTGVPPTQACDDLAAASDSGASPCVPCDDPADSTGGLPFCVGIVWEFSLAPAANEALVEVDPAALPPECDGG